MALLLAIDIGTSSAKAVLFDPDTAQIIASADEEYPLSQPTPDRAEQNPADWWLATVSVVGQCLLQSERRDVSAVGLAGQMHGFVPLGAHHEVLHPAIIWADSRSAVEARDMVEKIGDKNYAAIAGTLPAAGFMGPTLLWLMRHQRDLFDRTKVALLPKDFVRMKLTGEVATDISDAAATGVFDVSKGTWSETILDALYFKASIFPKVLESAEVAGRLTTQAAEALGLSPGIPVVAGCADQPAQALANGLISQGMASITTGTGGQVCVPLQLERGQPVPTDPRLHVFNHAVPKRHYILGAILAAGLSLRWLRNLLGMQSTPDAYPTLSAEASSVQPGAEGLIFLPYLLGERTPHMDSLARGGFIGLRYYHGRGHLARAVMEGVTFALRQTLDISLQVGGITLKDLIIAGGGAESSVWRQIQTDVFGLTTKKTLLKEQTCIGAALLAGIATGTYSDYEEASAAVMQHDSPVEPDNHRHEQYNALYQQFIELYPRLKADFHSLSAQKG
jgi:xylulokinase